MSPFVFWGFAKVVIHRIWFETWVCIPPGFKFSNTTQRIKKQTSLPTPTPRPAWREEGIDKYHRPAGQGPRDELRKKQLPPPQHEAMSCHCLPLPDRACSLNPRFNISSASSRTNILILATGNGASGEACQKWGM